MGASSLQILVIPDNGSSYHETTLARLFDGHLEPL